MITASAATIWFIIGVMAVGTYLIRLSFLGALGGRKMPDWVLRHLRYTPVAVIPGLVAPLVIWPQAAGGAMEPARMTAALVTLAVGYFTRNAIWAIVAGAVTLYSALALLAA
jgi:branched-subunit amino acid transport protein